MKKYVHTIQNNKLFMKAFNLMLSSGIVSFFGFLFWVIIARTHPSDEIGIATSLISVALLLSLFSQAGFDTSFVRFLSKWTDKNSLISTGLILSGIASIVLSVTFSLLTPLVAPELGFLAQNLIFMLGFALFTLFATWNTLTNAALIAYRKTGYILVIDIIFSIIKVTLPFLFVASGAMAIFAIVGIAQVINVGLSLYVLINKFDYRPRIRLDRTTLRKTRRFGVGVYSANILNLLPDSLLPLIVLNRLGASSAAFFYIAFAVANLVYTIAFATMQVLLAESSHDEKKYLEHAKKGLRIASALLIPTIAVVFLLAPYLLQIFGHEYSSGGLELLRILVLSGLLVMLYSFFGYTFKREKDTKSLIIMTGANAIGILGLTPFFIDKFGIVGIGWAWVAGTAIAVATGWILLKLKQTKTTKPLPKTPRNILITHVYSEDNKGDAALLSVLIDDIRSAYPKAKIKILTIDLIESKNHTFDGVPVRKAFMYYSLNTFKNRPMILLYSCYVMSSTLLWSLGKRYLQVGLPLPKSIKEVCKIYQSSDLIIPVGGGYIRSQKNGIGSLLNVAQLLHPLVFAHILKKPVVLYSQSIGPFSSSLEKLFVRAVLNTCVNAAMIREEVSVKLLKKIGVSSPIYRSVDSGFGFTAKSNYDLRKKLGLKKSQLVFGVTARKWLSSEAQEKYEDALTNVVNHVIKKHNAVVVLIPQVTAEFHNDDDRLVHNRIAHNADSPNKVFAVNEKLDHHDVKAAYKSIDILIGTRFHSVIFALTSDVPAIAIEYEHKTSGIMQDLKLDDWVIKMEEVNAKRLIALADKILKESPKYKSQLAKTLPNYVKKTREPITIVENTYASISSN